MSGRRPDAPDPGRERPATVDVAVYALWQAPPDDRGIVEVPVTFLRRMLSHLEDVEHEVHHLRRSSASSRSEIFGYDVFDEVFP